MKIRTWINPTEQARTKKKKKTEKGYSPIRYSSLPAENEKEEREAWLASYLFLTPTLCIGDAEKEREGEKLLSRSLQITQLKDDECEIAKSSPMDCLILVTEYLASWIQNKISTK